MQKKIDILRSKHASQGKVTTFASPPTAPSSSDATKQQLAALQHQEDMDFDWSTLASNKTTASNVKCRVDDSDDDDDDDYNDEDYYPPGTLPKVALDVEMVTSKEKVFRRHKNKAAEVSIVDEDYKIVNGIDELKVYHAADSFLVNQWCYFGKHDLEDGKSLDEVQKKIDESINGRIVLVWGEVSGDMDALEMNFPHVYNLQKMFRGPAFPEKRFLKLRDVVQAYYGLDIQPTGSKHSSLTDAIYTMKLFVEQIRDSKGYLDCAQKISDLNKKRASK